MSLDIQPVLVFADGTPVSSLNPLPTTGGGGGGTVDQGAANGDAAKGWSTRLTDGTAFIVPAKTGQLPAALGATTAAGSMSVGIATDQLATLATAAKQDTSNAALTSIDTKLTAPLPIAQQSATYSVISTSTTTVVAGAAITLYKIFWAAGVGSTLAAYDNGVGGTTNQFASKLTSTDGEIDFGPLGVRLSSGLTIVTTGGTPAYITVILRS